MKNRGLQFIIISALFLGGLLLVSYGISQSNAQQPEMHNAFGTTVYIPPTATRMPGCINYPVEKINTLRPTATPGRGTLVKSQFVPTVTLLPVTSTFDLSPATSRYEKLLVIVFRCDGTYVQYLVGHDIKIPEDLHLQVGDTIIDEISSAHSVEAPTLSGPLQSIVRPNGTMAPTIKFTEIIKAPYPAQNTFAPYPISINTPANIP